MTLVQDHDLVSEMLIVTLSTDTAHILTESGETACDLFEFDMDEIKTDSDGHVFYRTRFFGHHGLIHEDDTWCPHTKSLCSYCDDTVPNDLQAQLFTDEKFRCVSDVTVGDPR